MCCVETSDVIVNLVKMTALTWQIYVNELPLIAPWAVLDSVNVLTS